MQSTMSTLSSSSGLTHRTMIGGKRPTKLPREGSNHLGLAALTSDFVKDSGGLVS